MAATPRTGRSSMPMADVCLILEGTYPFVTGGVSSWVHEIITGMPELTFSLFHISGTLEPDRKVRYELPSNVVSFLDCAIQEPLVHGDRRPRWSPRRARRMWQAIERFHGSALEEKKVAFDELMRGYACPGQRVLNTEDLLLSRRGFRQLVRAYEERCPGDSFIDFFWTWRGVHLPIFQMCNIETPPARVYHLVCTGYAGLAGAVAKIRTGRPLLLTEHGIYVKERKLEISRADWIYSAPERVVKVRSRPGLLKQIWTDNFVVLGKLCYDYCDEIMTLYGGNRDLQVEYGAPPEKLRVIPNGVKTEIFGPLRQKPRPDDGVRRVGFVGRVVPIKDVKAFIKACKLCADRVPNVEFLVLGPTNEDEPYFEECQGLVRMLGLEDRVKFYGRVDVREHYPRLDLFVLTSVSEGQPLTILEAACAGVPTISTNVGGCSEMLLGRTDEDRAIGPSGIITNIGRPAETAEAMITLLTNEPLRQQMIANGLRRIEAYYRQDRVIDQYRDIYLRWRDQPDVSAWRA